MSNSLAIAAVTKTLVNLITHGVRSCQPKVTTLPPEKRAKQVRTNSTFFYHTPLTPPGRTWMCLRQIRPGERATTSWIKSSLLDNWLRQGTTTISSANNGWASDEHLATTGARGEGNRERPGTSGLQNQSSASDHATVNVVEEMSKLWTAFQAPYQFRGLSGGRGSDREHSTVTNSLRYWRVDRMIPARGAS